MNAFITGSRAYGTPHEDSDIDLVIRGDSTTYQALVKHASSKKTLLHAALDPTYPGTPLYFGNLNIIFCHNDEDFAGWHLGTQQLIKEKPVSRDKAKIVIAKACETINKL